MSIDPKDLEAINRQVKVNKGPLSFGVSHDPGDKSPPPIDDAISQNVDANPQPVNVAAALKGIMTMVDMGFKLGFSRVEQIDYSGFNDSELTILSESGTQVPELASIATSESTGKYMFYITLLGMMGSKFKMSESYKAKKALEKKQKEMLLGAQVSQEDVSLLKEMSNHSMTDEQIVEKLTGMTKKEPIYDGVPVDNSEPVQFGGQYEETLSPAELKTKELLAEDTGLSKPELDQRRRDATLRSKMIKRAEQIARENANKGGVGYAD